MCNNCWVRVQAIAAHRSKENESLLLRLLVVPEEIRPAGCRGGCSIWVLRLKAIEVVRPIAPTERRTKLAESLVARGIAIDPEEPLHRWLLASDSLNCGAQMVLYEKARTPREIKPLIERQFAAYSSDALARCLGLSRQVEGGQASAVPGAGRAAPSGVAALPSAARLWSDEFRSQLESQLGSRSLEGQLQLVLLASTIPQDSTRARLFEVLQRRVSDDPKVLQAAGLVDRIITDPGLLVSIKALLRKQLASLHSASSGRARGRAGVEGGEAATRQRAERAWCDLSAKLALHGAVDFILWHWQRRNPTRCRETK